MLFFKFHNSSSCFDLLDLNLSLHLWKFTFAFVGFCSVELVRLFLFCVVELLLEYSELRFVYWLLEAVDFCMELFVFVELCWI